MVYIKVFINILHLLNGGYIMDEEINGHSVSECPPWRVLPDFRAG